MAKRPYRMQVRANRAAETSQRILEAFLALFAERWLDQLTLNEVAARAGVTVQTVIRRFGSKEGLIAAADALVHAEAAAQRNEAPDDDIDGAIHNLVTHYEAMGDRVLRLLAQEERWPSLKSVADAGRVGHRAWVEGKFAPFLTGRENATRARLVAMLVSVTDVYVWKLLRRDQGLDRDTTEAALRDLVTALLATGRC